MIKQIRFFKLNNEIGLPDLKLGDSINKLLNSKLIYFDKNTSCLKYIKNEKISIGNKSGFVEYIHFSRKAGMDILNIAPYYFKYPATETITEFISVKHKHLSKIKTLEELKKSDNGDYLVLIFSDYILTSTILIQVNR